MAKQTTFTAPSGLSAVVCDQRGAKVVSLVDARGREWLTRTERVAPAGLGFLQAEMAGWDECAPTIDACTVNGVHLPDHGDVWDEAWQPQGDGSLEVSGTSWPYRLGRSIAAGPRGGLRFDYRARAIDAPVPFSWAAHPQFTAMPGTRVVLPGSVREVLDGMNAARRRLTWTDALGTIDSVPEGGCRKLWVAPEVHIDHVALERPDGARLTLRFPPLVRYLALWFDHGAFASSSVIALEPSLGPADALTSVIDAGAAVALDSTWTRWWLDVDVED